MLYKDLTKKQIDALKEVSNIGAGHATTALSQMIDKTLQLQVPSVDILALDNVPDVVGGAEARVVGLYLKVFGDTRGNILLLFPEESAMKLVELLVGKEIDGDFELNDVETSALKEVGNILTSSYLSSIGKLLDMSLVPSVPGIAHDMAGAVMDYILIELSRVGDTALLIETQFLESDDQIQGHFFLIPDPSSLKTFVEASAL